jgi:hypothetical protein
MPRLIFFCDPEKPREAIPHERRECTVVPIRKADRRRSPGPENPYVPSGRNQKIVQEVDGKLYTGKYRYFTVVLM